MRILVRYATKTGGNFDFQLFSYRRFARTFAISIRNKELHASFDASYVLQSMMIAFSGFHSREVMKDCKNVTKMAPNTLEEQQPLPRGAHTTIIK